MPTEGKQLLDLARKAIDSKLDSKELTVDSQIKENFNEPKGCFVTLYLDEQLRGCIGYPQPVSPLWKAIISAARAAAFSDPRFPKLSKDEFERVRIEISVLTIPEKIEEGLPDCIKVGEDGLIVEAPHSSGLLLPQVAKEQGWDSKNFLEHTCLKAGLDKDEWQECDVYKFQAQVFSE